VPVSGLSALRGNAWKPNRSSRLPRNRVRCDSPHTAMTPPHPHHSRTPGPRAPAWQVGDRVRVALVDDMAWALAR